MAMLRALNQKTARHLPFTAFLDLAQSLGCVGVEVRNDLGRPLFDGLSPAAAAQQASDRGLRLLSLCEIYAFNVWDAQRADEVKALIETAQVCGAESISLVPCVDERSPPAATRDQVLREVLSRIAEMLEHRSLHALVEPIGFDRSSIRQKAALIQAIEAINGFRFFKVLHDTFQHTIAQDPDLFASHTGLVHISGISVPDEALSEQLDAHRVLVNAGDRCGTIAQMHALLAAGYQGAFSFECTESTLLLGDRLKQDIEASFQYIEAGLPQDDH